MIKNALTIGFVALIVNLSIPKLFPYGPGQIILDRPLITDVDPTIHTIHPGAIGDGNFMKIYQRLKADQEPVLIGPETIVIDHESNMYALARQHIVQVTNFSEPEDASKNVILADVNIVATTPGFLLGGKFVPKTSILYFADAVLGLCRVDVSQLNPKVEIVASTFQLDDGTWSHIYYADDVDIGKSGMVYFSDATDVRPERDDYLGWNSMDGYMMDLMRGKKTGRLLRYDPSTDKIDVLADGIYFANGIAVDEDEQFVIISETSMLRLLKYHLKGPKEGQLEVMVDGLPGMPDGADCSKEFCYAPLPSSCPPIVKLMFTLPPVLDAWLRTFVMTLPKSVRPKPTRYAGVVEVTPNGNSINRIFQDPIGEHTHMITGVTEHDGKLYCGSLHNDYIGVIDLSKKID